jgi:hypothetical protein
LLALNGLPFVLRASANTSSAPGTIFLAPRPHPTHRGVGCTSTRKTAPVSLPAIISKYTLYTDLLLRSIVREARCWRRCWLASCHLRDAGAIRFARSGVACVTAHVTHPCGAVLQPEAQRMGRLCQAPGSERDPFRTFRDTVRGSCRPGDAATLINCASTTDFPQSNINITSDANAAPRMPRDVSRAAGCRPRWLGMR